MTSAKRILAYGDSLTWGFDAETGLRHAQSDLWPSVLQAGLNGAAQVIHDGLNGRTTCFDDYASPSCRNAVKTLPVALGSQMPLDLVILMLGTNDLKAIHGGVAAASQAGLRRLIQIIRSFPYRPETAIPQVLIVAPPHVTAGFDGDPQGHEIAQSHKFAALYQALATETGCGFVDASSLARPSPVDGVHLDAGATRAIGDGLVGPVRDLIC